MKEILTEHFHIYSEYGHIICYFEILVKNKTYIIWEFIDHKLNAKDTWNI